MTRVELADVFFAGGPRTGSGRATRRLQRGLIGAEVALVALLLVGAGLTLRSVQSLTEVHPGFDTDQRLAVRLTLPVSRYPDSASIGRFVGALTERVTTIPGVEAAGTVTTLPLSGGPGYTSFHVARSLPTPPPGEEPLGGMDIVGPGYFETMGIPVIQGRTYRPQDIESAGPIIIVDEAVVAGLGSTSPLTDAIRMAPQGAGAAAVWREVIGVVGSVRYGLDADVRPRIYLTEGQVGFTLRPRTLVVRVRPGSEQTVVPAIREAVRAVDPLLPIERIEWLDDVSYSSISRARLPSVLLSLFALVALILGAVGVYGVVSYSVTRRTREVGLRLALGSSKRAVLRHVVVEAMSPVLLGLGVGVALSAVASRSLAALLPAVEPLDAVAFAGGPLALLPVALMASILPALRAARVDPVVALREE